jgi:FtsZ-interacting cell division protein ZipA
VLPADGGFVEKNRDASLKMSQLQIGLISLGALIILAVLLSNWWQERKLKQDTVRRFDRPIDDVLMEETHSPRQPGTEGDFRIDPDAVAEFSQEDSRVDAHFAETAQPAASSSQIMFEETQPDQEYFADDIAPEPIRLSDPEPAAFSTAELPATIDPQIDDIAIITLAHPSSGAAIHEALQPLPTFHKSVHWLGQVSSGASHPINKAHENIEFTRIIGALQLVDRAGPANGEDLRNFHAKVEELAIRIDGEVEWRERNDPLHYARELDQFCIDVDVMISLQINTTTGSPFAGTKLRGLAEAAGLTLEDDGRFHFVNDAGESLFALACIDHRPFTPDVLRTVLLRGVVLMMDVPHVANGSEIFNQMVLLARKMEAALSSRLMDENQQPLGDAEIDKIRQQLKVIYSKMYARGVTPGNTTALRLFS